jgi:hypothetical protein
LIVHRSLNKKKEVVMKINYGITAVIIILLLLVSSFSCAPAPPEREAHHLAVIQIDNIWWVVDAQDSEKFPIRVRRGDTVTWTAHGSDAYFQFMDSTLVVDIEGSRVYRMTIADGQSRDLTIGPNARRGPHQYAVFILRDSTFARGQSPPQIIVR